MKIARLPKATKKIYASPSKTQAKAWNRQFKLIKDKKLIKTVETMLKAPEHYDSRAWGFAGAALNELYIRKWGKNHPDSLEELKDRVAYHSKYCFASRGYALETAGLIKNPKAETKGKIKVVHPYAYSKKAKKIIAKWRKSNSKQSLETYMAKNISGKDIRYLKNNAITYLSSKDRDKYAVTFTKKKVKIGNKTPEDGWYIFVLGGNPQMLLAGTKEKGKFHHTSFFAGAPVQCAGEFIVEEGKLTSACLRSGHYKPTEEHEDVLRQYLRQDNNLGPKKAAKLYIEPYEN